MNRITTILLVAILATLAPPKAFALILGGAGNTPLNDPGWPKGAAIIFNQPGRIAWWEGPPLGGGQWHAECRGDALALSLVLDDFAKLDLKTRRIVLHDGSGQSFWLNPNHQAEKVAAARIDWIFMVWQPASWERSRKFPPGLNPTDSNDAGPSSQIDVFTGGIRWSDVTVPKGIEVIDQRLETHGFTVADGLVLEGKVTDLATHGPIAATVRIERVEPRKQGGYHYPVVARTTADAQGHWVLKQAPTGWVRVVVEAAGFVPRIAGYGQFDDQPRWQFYDCSLARPAPVSGRITDAAGMPLADVEVRLMDVVDRAGRPYESLLETFKTDVEGRFRADEVPAGKATIWLSKPGYCRPGLGLSITTPKAGIELPMVQSAQVRVTVDFKDQERPNGYIVMIEPEGGEAVGKYGGSGNIDAANRIKFENVPPGRYVLRGQPNPSRGDERTEPVTIDLKGGERSEVTLKAK